MTTTDHELVEQMVLGETAAAETLFERHGARLYGAALRLTGNPADAGDVLLDVSAQAWRDAARFDAGHLDAENSGAERARVSDWLDTLVQSHSAVARRARDRRVSMGDAKATDADADADRDVDAASHVDHGSSNEDVAVPPALRGRIVERIALEKDELFRMNETAEQSIPVSVAAPPAPATPPSSPEPLPDVARQPLETPRAVVVTPLRPPQPVSRGSAGGAWGTAGVLTIALAAVGFLAMKLRDRVNELESESVTQQRIIDLTASQLASRDSTVDALTLGDADIVRVRLVGDSMAPSVGSPEPAAESGRRKAAMQVYWNRETGQAVVHAVGIPRPAADRTYSLWTLHDDTAELVTQFRPDAAGRVLLNAISIPGRGEAIQAFTVTEEPASGSTQPTMAPLLMGQTPVAAAQPAPNPSAGRTRRRPPTGAFRLQ